MPPTRSTMTFGFVINNDTCIGCHACSTACKSENEVPLGVHRTWVKSVEAGEYPDVRRHFQVTRCNHCANAPCVEICPVTAMYQRDDGIVEFDGDVCIGCKACLQACPYDAIYVDPDSGTAAKCHYCAHRTDIGLEPACVVVCPEHSIIAGDMDDPESEISRILAENEVSVRKPEAGTSPKLFYISGNEVTLNPTAVEGEPVTYAWSDNTSDSTSHSTSDSVLKSAGRMAEHMVQATYNVHHRMPWHWPVPAYLVTKAIGAGIALWLAIAYLFGWFALPEVKYVVLLGVSLFFSGVTTALLVYDLERPERFLRILTRPQWRSWLTRGAFLLVGFAAVTTLWFLLEAVGPTDDRIRWILAALTIPLASGAAIYTAFLFGQAKGRDLWLTSLLPVQMLVQALVVGPGVLLLVSALMGGATGAGPEFGLTTAGLGATRTLFTGAIAVHLAILLMGKFVTKHRTDAAAIASRDIHNGRYRLHFWVGGVIMGHVGPLVLLQTGAAVAVALAALLSVAGMYLYEYAFVMAPQRVRNS